MNRSSTKRGSVPRCAPPPGLKPWDRTLSHQEAVRLGICYHQYFLHKMGAPKAPRDAGKFIGDLAHDAAKETDVVAREARLTRDFQKLPDEMRDEVESAVRKCLANNAKYEGEQVLRRQKDKMLLTCPGPVIGWTLVAKPDETGMVDGGRGSLVLQIVELKTMARYITQNAIDQVVWAGTVADVGGFQNYWGPKKLVIRLLYNDEQKVIWYSRLETSRNMRRIATKIRRIEKCVAENNFPTRTGNHCHRCDYRLSCPAYAAMVEGQAREAGPTLVQIGLPPVEKKVVSL